MTSAVKATFDYTKSNAELVKLASEVEFPSYVKSADTKELKDTSGLDSTLFADQNGRCFPLHTKAACFLSAAALFSRKSEFVKAAYDRMESQIARYAAYWQIGADVDKLRAKYEGIEKKAEASLSDADFAMVRKMDDGTTQRHYPLRNAAEVKAAAAWLCKYQDRFNYDDRKTMATKILDKAASFGAAISDSEANGLEKAAGRGIATAGQVVECLNGRRLLALSKSRDKEAQALAGLQATIAQDQSIIMQPGVMSKIAATLEDVDKALGIQYGDYFKPPTDALFGTTFSKIASERATMCEMTTGSVYSKEQFGKIAAEELRSIFGDEFVSRIRFGTQVDPEKLAQIAHTLPRPDAELLEQVLASKGVHPVLSKSASRDFMEDQDLRSLASQYRPGKHSDEVMAALGQADLQMLRR